MRHCKSCGLELCNQACSCEHSSLLFVPHLLLSERMHSSHLSCWLPKWLLGLACLILLGTSLFLGNGNAFASTSPLLVVSQTSYNGNTDCSYRRSANWSCQVTLSRIDGLHKNLRWSAWGSGIPGITFHPARGLLPPGSSVLVNITIPNTVCPASANFIFKGLHNTISIPWSCQPSQSMAPPKSTVTPTNVAPKKTSKKTSNITNSSISITNLSTGSLRLNGRDQILGYSLTFTLNNATTQGWHVTIASTQFTTGSVHNHTLPATALSVMDVSGACLTGSCNPANNQMRYPLLVPAGNAVSHPVTLYDSAGNGSGIGSFTVTVLIHILVPGNAYAGTYTSSITVTLITGSL
jgi:hypothetical protein